jgi:hypothetical protein
MAFENIVELIGFLGIYIILSCIGILHTCFITFFEYNLFNVYIFQPPTSSNNFRVNDTSPTRISDVEESSDQESSGSSSLVVTPQRTPQSRESVNVSEAVLP